MQKKDYLGAEPQLHKVVNDDPANYVAWFDLGCAENGLGKVDESIAAYRKSVAAKRKGSSPMPVLSLSSPPEPLPASAGSREGST